MMIKKIRTFINLVESPGGVWLFIRIGAWAFLMPILVHFLSIPDLMRFITPRKNSSKQWRQDKLRNMAFFWAGQKKPLLRGTCLKRSLVLYRYLRLQGEPAQIFFGMRKEQGELKGHAWVLIDGKPVLDNEDLNYQVVYSYPEAKARGDRGLEELSGIMD